MHAHTHTHAKHTTHAPAVVCFHGMLKQGPLSIQEEHRPDDESKARLIMQGFSKRRCMSTLRGQHLSHSAAAALVKSKCTQQILASTARHCGATTKHSRHDQKRPQIASAAFLLGGTKKNFAEQLKRTNLRGGEVGELGASRLQLHE